MSTDSKNTTSQKIGWEYCECGCHGHEIRFGPIYFWLFNDLGKGSDSDKHGFHLFNSHMGITSKIIGTYDSFKEADEAARNIAREKLKKYREELEKAEVGL